MVDNMKPTKALREKKYTQEWLDFSDEYSSPITYEDFETVYEQGKVDEAFEQQEYLKGIQKKLEQDFNTKKKALAKKIKRDFIRDLLIKMSNENVGCIMKMELEIMLEELSK